MVEEGSSFWACKNEQQFKMAYINERIKSKGNIAQRIFCIETEETTAGFPDVMEVISGGGANYAYFYEFKFSDKSGKIKFQPTQPAFYRKNKNLKVQVVAFNVKTGNVHKFYAEDIFDSSSDYTMNLRAEVNLGKAERRLK